MENGVAMGLVSRMLMCIPLGGLANRSSEADAPTNPVSRKPTNEETAMSSERVIGPLCRLRCRSIHY